VTTALQMPVLLAATLATGLTAGFLYAFAHTVMPGLSATDERTYVRAFQGVDRAVSNPWFMLAFLGGPLLLAAALLLSLGDTRTWLWSGVWLGAALALSVATILVTGAVHLPLNREIQDVATDAGPADLAAARERFEQRWVTWNVVRTATSTGTFVCAALALTRV